MYTAYVLDPTQRDALLTSQLAPMFEKVIAHHITLEFGVSKKAKLPEQPTTVQIIGHVVNPKGLEAYACMVDGRHVREDGKIFHITWSLTEGVFKPKDSNTMLQDGFNLIAPIVISVTPQLLK